MEPDTKPKRTMTPEMLEKLAQAREKALEKKRLLKDLHEKEKAIRDAELQARVNRVEEFEKAQKPSPPAKEHVEDDSTENEPIVEVLKTAKKKLAIAPKPQARPKVQKVVKRVVQVDSSSESESDGEIDYKTLPEK
jgi:hypothetical protein